MLLFNDMLSSSQVKGRRFGCAPRVAFDKEVFAVLAAEFLPGDRFGLTQNGSDPLASRKQVLYAFLELHFELRQREIPHL